VFFGPVGLPAGRAVLILLVVVPSYSPGTRSRVLFRAL